MSNLLSLCSLLENSIITTKEFAKFEKRITRQNEIYEKAQLVNDLSNDVLGFVTPGTQYKISDLVLGVMEIKAPCHGTKNDPYNETPEQRKFRDGVAKPRMIAALELIGATKHGAGAQTTYSIGEVEAAELVPVVES